MTNRELREWLGLTPADLLVYLAAAALVAMFLLHDRALDMVLAATAVVLTVAACPLGMRRDPEVSGLTNAIKLVSYPLAVLLVVGVIVLHYAWFSP